MTITSCRFCRNSVPEKFRTFGRLEFPMQSDPAFMMKKHYRHFLILAVIPVVVFLSLQVQKATKEKAKIRHRYETMSNFLLSGDTNAVMEFFAPHLKNKAAKRFDVFSRFAKPLSSKSGIRLSVMGWFARVVGSNTILRWSINPRIRVTRTRTAPLA